MHTVAPDNLRSPLTLEEICWRLRDGSALGEWRDRWQHDEAVIAAHRLLAREAIAEIPPYPDDFWGRGIVIPAGGAKYFTPAWVCASMLRHLGCQLPIQFWHLGEDELDERMRELEAIRRQPDHRYHDALRLAKLTFPARRRPKTPKSGKAHRALTKCALRIQ
jgi:hypothetical protein